MKGLFLFMKRIMFMMYDMHCGGVEKALISLLNKIDYTEYSVTLLLINQHGEYLEDIPDLVEIKTIEMPVDLKYELIFSNKKAIKKLFYEKRYLSLTKKLYKLIYFKTIGKTRKNQEIFRYADKVLPIYSEEYDLAIDFQGLGSGLFNTFYVAKKIVAKKKASWIHQDVSIIKENVSWINEYYKEYNKIFSVSKYAEQEFLKLFPNLKEKSDVFYNILPVDDILELSNENILLPYYNEKTSILSVGRLSYQKGYDIAFKAIKKLVDDQYDLKYFIIGEGEQRKELESLILRYGLSDKVVLLGYIKNPYPFMKACDLYLQPSRFEGFCLTLGEAKIFNKPIITTDFAGAREQIKNQETGVIINCNEYEIYESIKAMLDNNSLTEKLKMNLQKQNKSTENNIDKINKLSL
jgi:glycosyltransferase involved in cell wall biosynthesis